MAWKRWKGWNDPFWHNWRTPAPVPAVAMIPISDDNPARFFPYVTVTLIVLCVLTFLWELSLGRAMGRAVHGFGFTPALL